LEEEEEEDEEGAFLFLEGGGRGLPLVEVAMIDNFAGKRKSAPREKVVAEKFSFFRDALPRVPLERARTGLRDLKREEEESRPLRGFSSSCITKKER